jgi:hypothetical protein
MFRVELTYRTKRGRTRLGMTITADCECAAEEQAREKHLKPYPARKFEMLTVKPMRYITDHHP